MAKDFKAGQIKSSKIISKTDSPLFVYSSKLAGVADDGVNTIVTTDIGTDVSVYFHGEASGDYATGNGSTLFNGDVIVSGSLKDGTGAAFSTSASVGAAGLVQLSATAGAFASADDLKYSSGMVSLRTTAHAFDSKLHVESNIADSVPTLTLTTTGTANVNESLKIVNESTTATTKIVKIDSAGDELFILKKDGLAKLSHTDPNLSVLSTGTTSLISIENTLPGLSSTQITQNSGNFSIENVGDNKIVEMIGTYGGGSPVKYDVIRGWVNVSNFPTVMILTNPVVPAVSKAYDASASNDINFYVEGTAATLGTSVKASSWFGGDVKAEGCVARGSISHFYINANQNYNETVGAGAGSTTTNNSVVWNANIIADPLFYTQSGKDITILKTGLYKITYTINSSQVQPAGGRINYHTKIILNPGGGSSILPCSAAYSYGRGDGSAQTTYLTTNTMTTVANFTANDIINLDINHVAGATSSTIEFNMLANQTWILLERVG